MSYDVVKRSGMGNVSVTQELLGAIRDGFDVKAAVINIPVYTTSVGHENTLKSIGQFDGFYTNSGGVDKVVFCDEFNDYKFIEVELKNPEVSVQLGANLGREHFDIKYASKLKGEGIVVLSAHSKELSPVMEKLIVKESISPKCGYVFPEQSKIDSILIALNKVYGLPAKLHVPESAKNEDGYGKILLELQKISRNLNEQYSYSKVSGIVPALNSNVIDMSSDPYKSFRLDIAKNVARSHSKGILFRIDSSHEDSVTISMERADGVKLASLGFSGSLDTCRWEMDVVAGDPLVVDVLTLPDVSKMTVKGIATDGFRDIVSKMREEFSVIIPVTKPSAMVTLSEIKRAAIEVSKDVEQEGKKTLIECDSHPDLMSSKLTFIMSKSYPHIINAISNEIKMVRSNDKSRSLDSELELA